MLLGAPGAVAPGAPVYAHRWMRRVVVPVVYEVVRMRQLPHQPSMLPRCAHCYKTEHMPHGTMASSQHPRQNSPRPDPQPALPRQNSPTTALQRPIREKTRPTRHKAPILGHFSCAGRTCSRSRPPSGHAGRTNSRTGHSHVAALKPMTPLQPLMEASMKPPSPLLTPEQQPLKPASPLQPKNTPQTPISHPQRR